MFFRRKEGFCTIVWQEGLFTIVWQEGFFTIVWEATTAPQNLPGNKMQTCAFFVTKFRCKEIYFHCLIGECRQGSRFRTIKGGTIMESFLTRARILSIQTVKSLSHVDDCDHRNIAQASMTPTRVP